MDIRRFWIGTSVLIACFGMLLACFARGGWWNWSTNRLASFHGASLGEFAFALGFSPHQSLPVLGFFLALGGAFSGVIAWSLNRPDDQSIEQNNRSNNINNL